MRLLLTPHAPTDWNAQLRYQGWTDTHLSDTGRHQAALLANRLRNERIDACHASDLRRAEETVAAIGRMRNLAVVPDPNLREMHFGAWEGLTHQEMSRADPQAVLAWEADPMRVAPPGGETLTQVAERVAVFLGVVSKTEGDSAQTLLVVAHRGSLRVLLCLALGLSPAGWWRFRLEPASVTELDFCGKGVVLNFLNDTHHLREVDHDR